MPQTCNRKHCKLARPERYRRILDENNAKTIKGEALGYLTGILYLAPAEESGVMNTCPKATPACRAACLYTAGRGPMPNVIAGRMAKTLLLHQNRELFLDCLRWDIGKLVRRAAKLGLKPCVRLNGTSDLAWMAMAMAVEFPAVQFYDYTKLPGPWQRQQPNYRLTFSYSGHNLGEAQNALGHGVNVSVVFAVGKGEPLPLTWHGHRVIDGDAHDLRFLDEFGVVVGLRAKGRARYQISPFIVIPHQSDKNTPR
jgi:hypothetical protein